MNIDVLKWSLQELSDKELQENLWLGKIDGKMSSFSEAVCRVFDDSGLDIALKSKAQCNSISTAAIAKLLELGQLVDNVSGMMSPEDILSHPLMNQIRKVSGESLELLSN